MPATAPLDCFRLDGQVAWVTGASRGLGRSIAFGLAAAGATVVVSARDRAALDAVVAEIDRAGGRAVGIPLSVDDAAAVAEVAGEIRRSVGTPHVLVNGAGVSPSFAPAVDVDDRDWRSVLDVNLTGTFTCAREAGRQMLAEGRGSVISISSVHARSGGARLAAYSASKAAIESLTRTLALEWAGTGVRVNAVAPGYFETDMTAGLRSSDAHRARLLSRVPQGRFGTPDELVPAVLFLASEASAYTTGTTLTCDGGWTAV